MISRRSRRGDAGGRAWERAGGALCWFCGGFTIAQSGAMMIPPILRGVLPPCSTLLLRHPKTTPPTLWLDLPTSFFVVWVDPLVALRSSSLSSRRSPVSLVGADQGPSGPAPSSPDTASCSSPCSPSSAPRGGSASSQWSSRRAPATRPPSRGRPWSTHCGSRTAARDAQSQRDGRRSGSRGPGWWSARVLLLLVVLVLLAQSSSVADRGSWSSWTRCSSRCRSLRSRWRRSREPHRQHQQQHEHERGLSDPTE